MSSVGIARRDEGTSYLKDKDAAGITQAVQDELPSQLRVGSLIVY